MSDGALGPPRRAWSPGALAAAGAIALAMTAWIFTRAGSPFAGYDWVELIGFHKHHYRTSLLAGVMPWWNPLVGFGRPFMADIETAVCYPPNLLFLLPDVWALPACVAGHLLLILIGSLAFGRALQLGLVASLVGGITFALGSAVSARLQAGQVQVFCTLAHLPLWWTLLWRVWQAPTRRAIALAALVTASAVLAGSPPFLWAMGSAVALWLTGWSLGQPLRAWGRGIAGVGGAGLLGLALAAVQLVPFAELLAEGNRAWRDPEMAAFGALPWRNLASLFAPSGAGMKFYWEMNLFTGVLAPLGMLALAALWRDRTVRAFAFVAAGGVLLALEPPYGIAGWLAPWLPGAGALRLPCRYALVVGWAGAMVALLAWQRRTHGQSRPLAGALLTIHVGSLGWAVHLQAHHYAQSAPPAAELRIAAEVHRQVSASAPVPPRVALARDAVRANSGVLFGYSNLEWFANPGLARLWGPAHALAGVRPGAGNPAQTADLALQTPAALRRWGVQFGWDATRATFFSDPTAALRARAVFRTTLAGDAREAAQQWWAGSGELLVLEQSLRAAPKDTRALALAGSGPPPAYSLKILRYDSGAVDVAWHAKSPGWLVLAEPWYPGWRASAAGQPLEVRPANGWMRAVELPAGEFPVHFEFRPTGIGAGGLLSMLALAVVLIFLRRPR
jgi:hypothetical protein